MPYAQLFDWWIATISWSIAFLIVVSVYLYLRRVRPKAAKKEGRLKLVRDFAFVWFLLALLVFYIFTVSRGSSNLFAIGNLVFEALLVAYVLMTSRTRD